MRRFIRQAIEGVRRGKERVMNYAGRLAQIESEQQDTGVLSVDFLKRRKGFFDIATCDIHN